MKKPKVIHCVFGEGLSSVFSSQVLARIPSMADRYDQEVLVFSPLGQLLRKNQRTRTKELAKFAKDTYGVRVSHLALPPSRFLRFANPLKKMRNWLINNASGDVVLHCRNAKMASLALEVRNSLPQVRVVYDCRGVECDEFPFNQGLDANDQSAWPDELKQRYADLVEAERKSCLESNRILTVSDVMAKHLAEKYKIDDDIFGVIPCCVDVDRFVNASARRDEIRAQLQVQDRFVVTYLGSLAWYQLPDQSIRLFRILNDTIPNAHFLGITTQPDLMRQELNVAGIATDKATVLRVAPGDVPSYLAASDVGLLLRHDTIVNRVASPVKFGEYVAAGVPPIMTDCIGDYSATARNEKLGFVVDLESPDEEIQNSLGNVIEVGRQFAENARRFAQSDLRWEAYTDTVHNCYSAALGT